MYLVNFFKLYMMHVYFWKIGSSWTTLFQEGYEVNSRLQRKLIHR